MNNYPVPNTAREALSLVWELAYPLKEGHKGEPGTELIARFKDDDFRIYRALEPFDGDSVQRWAEVRALDPLPEPEPDWIDAPAVKARVKGYPVLFTWIPVDGPQHHRWHSPVKGQGETYDWQDLTDVTPLWPKEGQES